MDNKRLFASFEKTEAQDDGTLKVWGYASSEAVDSDGEVIKASAIAEALPEYLRFGCVREMHQAKAAGTAIEAHVQDDGRTYFGALIVDEQAVKKVKTGTYKGFSVGGRVLKRDDADKNIITGISLTEVSLVDRPANPGATFTMYKADGIDAPEAEPVDAVAALAKMVNEGATTPERLVELAKADAAPEEAVAIVTAPPAPEAVEKGMGHVAQLAMLLKELGYLTADQYAEASREGDDSAVPDALKAWLMQGVSIMTSMVAEEGAEIVATSDTAAPDDVIMLAAAAADLEKAGARNSKADQDKVQAVHDHSVGLGAACDGAAKADAVTPGVDLSKIAAADILAKAVQAAIEPLAKRIAEIEAQPAPAKALLRTVAKEADNAGIVKADAPEDLSKMTADERATHLIKRVHAGR